MSWSTVIGMGTLLVILVLAWAWIRAGQRRAVDAARTAAECEDAVRKSKEHEAVADVERRPLPPGVAGPRVRALRGKSFDGPPGGGGAPVA